MFDRQVLDALARAARASEDHIARQVLAKADPAIAWWLRRRVAKAIRWASSCVAEPSDRGHVLRLAFLHEARALDSVSFEDRSAVQASFEAIAARAPAVSHRWTTSMLAFGLALIAVLAGEIRARLRAPFEPSATALGQALGPALTDYVIQTSRASRSGATAEGAPASRDVASFPSSFSRVAPAISGPLLDVLRTYRTMALGPNCADPTCEEPLSAAVQRLNGGLHGAGDPYFVDYLILRDAEPMLMTYYVARERTATIEGSAVRLLRVQRLDDLDKTLGVVGYTSPRLGAALITLDTLERDLVQLVLPALRDGASASLVDAASREEGPPWAAVVERSAAEGLRRDYASYQSPDLDRVVALLTRREDLYRKFASAIARTGASLARPRRLVSPLSLDELEGYVTQSSLREWRDVNASLGEASARDAFDRMLERIADRVERHELQHQIDYRAGLVAVPADLGVLLGASDPALAPSAVAARCRDELSAELAAIATDAELATTMLTLSVGPIFDRTRWPTPYAFAGVVLLAAIDRELGAPSDTAAPIGLDRAWNAAAFVRVVARPGKDIAEAAARAYARLFGAPLLVPSLGPWTASPTWRR